MKQSGSSPPSHKTIVHRWPRPSCSTVQSAMPLLPSSIQPDLILQRAPLWLITLSLIAFKSFVMRGLVITYYRIYLIRSPESGSRIIRQVMRRVMYHRSLKIVRRNFARGSDYVTVTNDVNIGNKVAAMASEHHACPDVWFTHLISLLTLGFARTLRPLTNAATTL